MSDSKKKRTEEELNLIKETQKFMDEVNSNPEVAELTAPPEMKENVFAKIRELEAAKAKAETADKRSAEEEELIRLGKIYKKKRKARKYWVLAAAVVCALAFGMTSMGVPKKLFKRTKSKLVENEQVHTDSEEIIPVTDMDEEKAYREIEEKFGFTPVRMDYLPENVELLHTEINDTMQTASLVYGQEEKVKIIYMIRPNYRSSSIGEDVEDGLIDEYVHDSEYATIYIRKYLVEDKEERVTIHFDYMDVSYFLQVCDTSEEEIKEIVENLYFL